MATAVSDVSDPLPPAASSHRSLVVIAASAGGVAAVSQVLAALPATFPVPIVVVQHRSMEAPSRFVAWLERRTALRVLEARTCAVLARGNVYVAPPDMHLMIEANGTLGLTNGRRIRHTRSSANPLFSSAAEVFGPGVIAVVLTGIGTDGSDGVRDVKRHGGFVIAEHPETARFPSMPLSAIKTGDVDLVLPLGEIGPALLRLATPPSTGKGRDP